MSETVALYVHIPFCRHKCAYCSFVSYEGCQSDIHAYLRALKAEMAQRVSGETLSSVYLGGGTPSLLSTEQVSDLLTTIRSLFSVTEKAEITIEANPGTIDTAYLSVLKKIGVNRLSLGVQSLDDDELRLLGRIHTASEARQAVKAVRSAGFDNLNLDLIYGLPEQSLSDWQETMETAVSLGPEHLSLYSLTLEKGTPLSRAISNGLLPSPDPDLSAEQYELAEDLLAASGYRHYEISNWAREGYECRHNLVYWHNLEYIGLGVAAHSSLNDHRLANTSDMDGYITTYVNNLPFVPETDEEIAFALQLAESVILGLRLNEGISPNQIQERYGVDLFTSYQSEIEDMTEAGLLEYRQGSLKLTRRGRLLSNEVFWRLLPEESRVEIK